MHAVIYAQHCIQFKPQLSCRNIARGDPDCKLCQYNPNKTCHQHTDSKYIAFENLRSRCGADLYVHLVDAVGNPVAAELLPGIHLQVRVQSHVISKSIWSSNLSFSVTIRQYGTVELLAGIHLPVRVHFNVVIKTQFHNQQ